MYTFELSMIIVKYWEINRKLTANYPWKQKDNRESGNPEIILHLNFNISQRVKLVKVLDNFNKALN